MKEIIITTPEELRTLIAEAVKSSISPPQDHRAEPPDTITLAAALELLRENGYQMRMGRCGNGSFPRPIPGNKSNPIKKRSADLCANCV